MLKNAKNKGRFGGSGLAVRPALFFGSFHAGGGEDFFGHSPPASGHDFCNVDIRSRLTQFDALKARHRNTGGATTKKNCQNECIHQKSPWKKQTRNPRGGAIQLTL